jgi:hypothetical protein
MRRPGLDRDGFIEREGDLARVPPAFAPVVEAVRAEVTAVFGPASQDGADEPSACLPTACLHSAYLYGSIPRGTALPGVSDLDVLVALRHEPAPTDQAAATGLEHALDARFPQINGAGILLYSTATLLSELERYDLGWFAACLCTRCSATTSADSSRGTGPARCWPGKPTVTWTTP